MGFRSAMIGVKLSIVKISVFEVPPTVAGLTTVPSAVPAVAISEGMVAACNSMLDTKLVVLGLPFQRTVDDRTKFVPATVRVNVPTCASAVLGPISEIVGTGLLPPPPPVWEPPEPPPHPGKIRRLTQHIAIPVIRALRNNCP